MSKFEVNKLFVFDKTKEESNPICYDNAVFLYTDIGTNTVKNEITIINDKNVVVSDLPNNFKLVGFSETRMIYIPNVVREEGKFICHNDMVSVGDKKVETTLVIRHHFDFLKDNGIKLKMNLFDDWRP